MNIIDFTSTFPDEESCKNRWKEIRLKQGVVCPKCGCKQHYWKNDKECFECKQCSYRQSLRANTIMHRSQLSFRIWFLVFHLLTCTKKSFSALELQRQLGHKNYKPIWALAHKIRSAMGNRDSRYMLHDVVEVDEGFFSTERPEEEKDKPLKRGRGSQKKSIVLVMTESLPKEKNKCSRSKGNKDTAVRFLKMKRLDNVKTATITKNIKEHIDPSTKLVTDQLKSYSHLKDMVKEHEAHVSSKETVKKVLPWVHVAISNAKRLITDVYHDIKPEYLQYYLDEFCYKFNRRHFGQRLFDRLLIAGVTYKNEFIYSLPRFR